MASVGAVSVPILYDFSMASVGALAVSTLDDSTVALIGPPIVPNVNDSFFASVGMLTVPTLDDSSVTSVGPLTVSTLDDSSVALVGTPTVPTLDDSTVALVSSPHDSSVASIGMLTVPIQDDFCFVSINKTLNVSLDVIPSSEFAMMTLTGVLNSVRAYFSCFVGVAAASAPTGPTFKCVCSDEIIINSPCFIKPPDLFNLHSVVKTPAVCFNRLFMLFT